MDCDSETVVYHLGTGEVHRLDPVGATVWRSLDGRTTIADLAAELATAFEADPDVVRADVERLVEHLGEALLLADGPTPPPPTEPAVLGNPPSP